MVHNHYRFGILVYIISYLLVFVHVNQKKEKTVIAQEVLPLEDSPTSTGSVESVIGLLEVLS